MDEKRIWVTAYCIDDREILVTHPPAQNGYAASIIFTLDNGIARRQDTLGIDPAAARIAFYSIPDPF